MKNGLTVLLIAQDRLFRIGLKEELERGGYRVCESERDDRETALRLVACDPDVALIDCRHPGASGLLLLRTIKREKPACQVILLTTPLDRDTVEEATRYGASAYLDKLEDLGRILPAVEEALRRCPSA